MVKRDTDFSSERYKLILGAVVKDYIRRAEPVGSRAIAVNYDLGLSSATVRSVMAELEGGGFLSQPHTSAGRIPTEKGFRLYVDTLLELREPGEADKRLLRGCLERFFEGENLLSETTRLLSTITSCTGLAFVLRKENFVLRQVKLMDMDASSVVLVLVSSLGKLKTRLVHIGRDAGGLDFERISNYLSSIGRGLTVKELRARIVTEMSKEKNRYDELLSKALKLGDLALSNYSPSEDNTLYVEGKVNMLDYPEFRDDFDKMKKLFGAFEEKSMLVKILDRSMDEDDTHIYLGSESSIEGFEGMSFVTTPYGRNNHMSGTLGVIGPMRMDYSRIVPLVSYTAGLLEKIF
ncbi:MAG: heat-inducible transcriptional repressor HrcA [Thermodesulfobacteriota bacterium]|nr:MAG: heat-inducible transcriptional repressor HrcA [Thermodesulfobacteriota bacterium]